jgi:hypothetical protein
MAQIPLHVIWIDGLPKDASQRLPRDRRDRLDLTRQIMLGPLVQLSQQHSHPLALDHRLEQRSRWSVVIPPADQRRH